MSKESFFSNPKVQTFFGVITIISIIAFLVKILGRNSDTASRRKLYSKVNPSYDEFVYKDWADTLDTALLREATEDEDAVYRIFEKCRNISDVNKLIEAFGTRRQMFTLTYVSLPQAISSTFNKKEIRKVNDILASKGIQYSFN